MADRRRIKTPEVSVDAIKARVNEAHEVAKLPKEDRGVALQEFYGVDSHIRGKELLMIDIAIKYSSDAKTLPTHTKTRQKIFKEYTDITGNDRTNALRLFNKVQAMIKPYTNMGMINNHAAAVAQDVIARIHTDLDRLQEQELKIVRDIEDLDPNVEEQNKAIFKLEGRLNKIISMKNKAYERLLEYAKNFGIDLYIKDTQNQINAEKNEILDKKFTDDTNLTALDIQGKYGEMEHQELIKSVAQMISTDKGMSKAIEAKFKADQSTDEFKATDVTDESE